jgi:hypothetical protein
MNDNTQQLPSIFTRQPDAQFDVMERMLDAAQSDMNTSTQRVVETSDLEFAAQNGSIGIKVYENRSANAETPAPFMLTHYSLMQACRMAKFDTDVVRRLQGKGRIDLAVDNLNVLFPNEKNDCKIMLLDGQKRIRALNGADYSRLWDYTMFDQVNKCLIPNGFVPATVRYGCGALLPAGRTALFRGDQTSFGFFFTNDPAIDDVRLGLLRQGLMIWNSEVGARSFGFSTFYFREDSGTFLIWDRLGEKRKRFVHRGDINRGFREYMQVIREASRTATGSREEDLATFRTAADTKFADSFDEAVEKLNKLFDMPKAQAEAVVKASLLPQNGDNGRFTVWSISLGIAYEAAQTSRAESMVDDSVVAGKIIRRMVK